MRYSFVLVVAILLNGCVFFSKTQPKQQVTVKEKKPVWILNPSYNGKIAAVGKAGYTVYDNKQEEIAINSALLQLTKLSDSKVLLTQDLSLKKSFKSRDISYTSNTNATIINYKNIQAKITDRYVDKDGYLYIRLEMVEK